jgi:hypothetical protein
MGAHLTKPNLGYAETISVDHEDFQKQRPAILVPVDYTRSSVMSALLTFIYREYCRASLPGISDISLDG